ncbi:mid1-interacting protein 1-like [Tubulanus polymorphus]|uniref:mid1-interacting protein 1-like n=1 Tax=Tubulanus polymorphus TaxID=672921 RepID=UPI003DA2B926
MPGLFEPPLHHARSLIMDDTTAPQTSTDRRFNTVLEDSSKQSLLNAMNKFVTAVNAMDDTVMIPSRLLDLPVCDETTPAAAPPAVAGSANAKSSPPTNGKKQMISMNKLSKCDLYSFYVMLNTIKTDLVDGPASDDEDESEGSEDGASIQSDSRFAEVDEQSRQLAGAFRHHLQGLFHVLHQLTDTADHVSTRYQTEINKF